MLKMLGAAPAAPLAAKLANDATLAQLTGVNAGGLGGSSIAMPMGMPSTDGKCVGPITNFMSYEEGLVAASKYTKAFGLPEFVERGYREQSRYVNSLDPDIANKKSWSMSVKIQSQRQSGAQGFGLGSAGKDGARGASFAWL